MKIDHSAMLKLRAAKRVWGGFYPDCSLSGGRIVNWHFSFASTRILGAGVEASCRVAAVKVDDESCSLRVRMRLHDERVNALRAIAMGHDVSIEFLDFDVLSASSLMDGQERPNEPLIDSNAPVEEFARVVGDYSRRIDRIWNFVGGPSVQSLERLAIWALRNRGVEKLAEDMLGHICAAFAYGEEELAHEFIAGHMSDWEDATQLDLPDHVFDIFDDVRLQIERLQEAIGPLPDAYH